MHCKTHQLHGKSPRHRTDLRFYGELHFRKKDGTSYGDWMGVELDAPLGKNDGSFAVKRSSGDTELRRYFQCEQLHGLFALVNSKQIQLDLDGDSGSDESTDSEDEGKADIINGNSEAEAKAEADAVAEAKHAADAAAAKQAADAAAAEKAADEAKQAKANRKKAKAAAKAEAAAKAAAEEEGAAKARVERKAQREAKKKQRLAALAGDLKATQDSSALAEKQVLDVIERQMSLEKERREVQQAKEREKHAQERREEALKIQAAEKARLFEEELKVEAEAAEAAAASGVRDPEAEAAKSLFAKLAGDQPPVTPGDAGSCDDDDDDDDDAELHKLVAEAEELLSDDSDDDSVVGAGEDKSIDDSAASVAPHDEPEGAGDNLFEAHDLQSPLLNPFPAEAPAEVPAEAPAEAPADTPAEAHETVDLISEALAAESARAEADATRLAEEQRVTDEAAAAKAAADAEAARIAAESRRVEEEAEAARAAAEEDAIRLRKEVAARQAAAVLHAAGVAADKEAKEKWAAEEAAVNAARAQAEKAAAEELKAVAEEEAARNAAAAETARLAQEGSAHAEDIAQKLRAAAEKKSAEQAEEAAESSAVEAIIVPEDESQWVAGFDYAANDEDEISLVEGDVVFDVKDIDEGWVSVSCTRTGERGSVPKNYIVMVLLGADATTDTDTDTGTLAPAASTHWVAGFDYEATDVDEIDLTAGDICTDLEDVDDGWIIVTCARSGERGSVPRNYVTEMAASTTAGDGSPSVHRTGVVFFDYAAADDDEVTLVAGDTVVDIEDIDKGWISVTVSRTGERGSVPRNYVEESVEESVEETIMATEEPEESEAPEVAEDTEVPEVAAEAEVPEVPDMLEVLVKEEEPGVPETHADADATEEKAPAADESASDLGNAIPEPAGAAEASEAAAVAVPEGEFVPIASKDTEEALAMLSGSSDDDTDDDDDDDDDANDNGGAGSKPGPERSVSNISGVAINVDSTSSEGDSDSSIDERSDSGRTTSPDVSALKEKILSGSRSSTPDKSATNSEIEQIKLARERAVKEQEEAQQQQQSALEAAKAAQTAEAAARKEQAQAAAVEQEQKEQEWMERRRSQRQSMSLDDSAIMSLEPEQMHARLKAEAEAAEAAEKAEVTTDTVTAADVPKGRRSVLSEDDYLSSSDEDEDADADAPAAARAVREGAEPVAKAPSSDDALVDGAGVDAGVSNVPAALTLSPNDSSLTRQRSATMSPVFAMPPPPPTPPPSGAGRSLASTASTSAVSPAKFAFSEQDKAAASKEQAAPVTMRPETADGRNRISTVERSERGKSFLGRKKKGGGKGGRSSTMSAGSGTANRGNDPFNNFDYNDAAKEVASPPRKEVSRSPSPEPGPGASSSLLRDLINGCDATGDLPTLPDDESPQKAPNARQPLKKQEWYAQKVPNVTVKQDRPDKDFEKRAADSIMRSLRQSSKAKQPGLYYNVKHETLHDGSPSKNRGWSKNLYVVQMGHLMLFFKKQDEAQNRQLAGPCFLYVNSPYVTIPTDYTKKKVLRIRTFNKGTFLMEPVAHGVDQLKNRIKNPPVTVMDTTHFKSDESIADLDLFHKRQDGTGQARDDIQPVRVLLLGLAKSGKTSLLKRMLGEKFVEDRAASTSISTATVNWSKGVSFTVRCCYCWCAPSRWRVGVGVTTAGWN